MRKKVFIILGVILVIGIVGFFFLQFGVPWLFSSQYNEKGVSHFLVITIDKNQSREFVGELDEHKIYVEASSPRVVQEGGDGTPNDGYIKDIVDGTTIGFKYFDVNYTTVLLKIQ